jgi:flagellar protein FlaI
MAFAEVKGERLESAPLFSVFRAFPHNLFEVSLPVLSAEEKKVVFVLSKAISGKMGLLSLQHDLPNASSRFLDSFSKDFITQVQSFEALEKMPLLSDLETLKAQLVPVLKLFPAVHASALASQVIDDSLGFGVLGSILSEPSLEEIMVNGTGKPVFVVHRKFGMCKTNLVFSDSAQLEGIVQRIARTAGKPFDDTHPLLDARLSDGSRMNATFFGITPEGPTLTIRKFSKVPLSIADLIAMNTLSSEAAAFLWLMVEGLGLEPMNLIVTGGTSSGKTTSLNALASFSRSSDRIISIEDTLELDLGNRENWVRLEARTRSPLHDEVSMDDLLRNSLRMRPDRLVIGEVRGSEAQTLFVAMDTGHRGVLGTLHSNTAREMLLRLQQSPMSVAEVMLPLLNLIVVQVKLFLPGKGVVRRVSQITELSSMEGKPLLANVFEWDRALDKLRRTDTPSHVFEVLSEKTSLSKNDLKKELLLRQRILEWVGQNRFSSHQEIAEIIQRYYYDPQQLLEEIQKSLSGRTAMK